MPLSKRDREIIRMRLMGSTYVVIGKSYGLTKNRVRQVFDKWYYSRSKRNTVDSLLN